MFSGLASFRFYHKNQIFKRFQAENFILIPEKCKSKDQEFIY